MADVPTRDMVDAFERVFAGDVVQTHCQHRPGPGSGEIAVYAHVERRYEMGVRRWLNSLELQLLPAFDLSSRLVYAIVPKRRYSLTDTGRGVINERVMFWRNGYDHIVVDVVARGEAGDALAATKGPRAMVMLSDDAPNEARFACMRRYEHDRNLLVVAHGGGQTTMNAARAVAYQLRRDAVGLGRSPWMDEYAAAKGPGPAQAIIREVIEELSALEGLDGVMDKLRQAQAILPGGA